MTFGKQLRDVSYGRIPDGSSNWEHLTIPTPGWANGEGAPDDEASSGSGWWLVLIAAVVTVVVVAIYKVAGRSGK